MSILCLSLSLAFSFQSIPVFPLPNDIRSTGPAIHFHGLAIHGSPSLKNEIQAATSLFDNHQHNDLGLRLHLTPADKTLGVEGYRLMIARQGIRVDAPTSAGIFYGIQTLRQLATHNGNETTLPQLQIKDSPRFPWRGMMLDVSRHFFPKQDILHFLDLLSQYKINTFHWHLVDDGGWRIQIKKYPRLTDFGAWRVPSDGTFPEYKELDFPGTDRGKKLYGGYYTQDDVKEVVRYATARHINIVPEIEMPGHNLAATMSYPWLICSPKLQPGFQKETGFVFPNIFCAGKESTFNFVEDVLTEVLALFPSKVIHIGGDEVDKYLWSRCEDCKRRMLKEHLKTPAELESYFVRRIEKFLNARGRHLIGWDEILEGGLAPNAYVMSWQGEAGGIQAAKLHHFVVMTPWDQCYFDHNNHELPIDAVLGYDPAPPSRGPSLAKYVLGAQASIWTEHLPTRADIEDRMFPRMLAMAQILWTVKTEATPSFEKRLAYHLPTLYSQAPGCHFQPPATPFSVVKPGTPISFTASLVPGAALRYSLDTQPPTITSPLLKGPIALKDGRVISVALVAKSGPISESTVVTAKTFKPSATPIAGPGLRYRVILGAFEKLPNFTALTPSAKGITPTVKLVGGFKENYALQFEGFISIPRAGQYTFYCSSDDGSAILLDGVKIVDNDGLHGSQERSGTVELKPGNYAMTVGYFQGTEGQQLTLKISGPGVPKQPIPASMLSHS